MAVTSKCIAILLLRFISISKSITNVQFDEYGNKYIRARLTSNESKEYSISLDDADNQYLYIVGSSTINYQLINLGTNTTVSNAIDNRRRPYYLLEEPYVSGCDEYKLIITNYDSTTRSVWVRFNKGLRASPNKKYQDSIQIRKKRRYGIKLTISDLPVLVKLIPNQNYEKMDLDLYGYTERSFTSYFFPNRAERNHINNYPEQLLINEMDSYFINDIYYFFEVYGSTDSEYQNMDYSLEIITNYAPNFLLKKILLIFAFTIAGSFILGIILSFVCTFRHQILFCLRIRSTPHRNGVSKRQMRKLKIIKYKGIEMLNENIIDSTQCCICLDEYIENDAIRILKCNHCFHKNCSDEWLYINNKCPLCNQNIVDGKSVFGENINNNGHYKIEIEMAELRINPQSQELMTLESESPEL